MNDFLECLILTYLDDNSLCGLDKLICMSYSLPVIRSVWMLKFSIKNGLIETSDYISKYVSYDINCQYLPFRIQWIDGFSHPFMKKSYTTVPLFGFCAWCLGLFLSVQIYLSVNFIIREYIFINIILIVFVKELFWLLYVIVIKWQEMANTVEPLLRGHPDDRPTPLERPLDNVNLNINILIYTPDEGTPLLKGYFSYAKGAASQEGFHCISKVKSTFHCPMDRGIRGWDEILDVESGWKLIIGDNRRYTLICQTR